MASRADQTLVSGAFAAAGGNIKDYGLGAAKGLASISEKGFDTAKDVLESDVLLERNERAKTWAENELAKVEGKTAEEYKQLEKDYKRKRLQFVAGGPADQAMLMSELRQDIQQQKTAEALKKKTATKTLSSDTGLSEEFKADPQFQSIVDAYGGLPVYNEELESYGYEILNPNTGEKEFKTFSQVEQIVDENSFNVEGQMMLDQGIENTIRQSESLPWNRNVYDYDTNYRNFSRRVLNDKNMKSFETREHIPGRTYKEDMKQMIGNFTYEDLGIFTDATPRKEIEKFERQIRRLDRKYGTDGDPNKVSADDVDKIYDAMMADKKMGRDYLSRYYTNFAEKQWMKARWRRKDAPPEPPPGSEKTSGVEVGPPQKSYEAGGGYVSEDGVFTPNTEMGRGGMYVDVDAKSPTLGQVGVGEDIDTTTLGSAGYVIDTDPESPTVGQLIRNPNNPQFDLLTESEFDNLTKENKIYNLTESDVDDYQGVMDSYDYKVINGEWHFRKKGQSGKFQPFSKFGNKGVDKAEALNKKFPDALK